MRKRYTKVQNHKVMDLVEAFHGESRSLKIEVPTFQRNIVWSQNQKKELITSIKNGYPVGSLLFYEEENKNLLIDGLQRTSSLAAYIKDPTAFYDENDIPADLVELMFNALKSEKVIENGDFDYFDKNFRKEMRKWISKVSSFNSQVFDAFLLLDHVKEWVETDSFFENPTLFTMMYQNHGRDVSKHINSIREESLIDDIEIPVVIYNGPYENLPEIFELINKQGTKLSKYQIFAAKWDKTFSYNGTKQEEYERIIDEKYSSLEEYGYKIYNRNNQSLGVTEEKSYLLFDYLFAISKDLKRKFPILFAPRDYKNDDEQELVSVDDTGFMLMSVALGLPLNKMAYLEDRFVELNRAGKIDRFLNAIYSAASEVDQYLRPVLNFKSNKRVLSNNAVHGKHQMISIVATIFYAKYDQEYGVSPDWPSSQSQGRRDYAQNIRLHYLYDTLRSEWQGPTDSKLKNSLNLMDISNLESSQLINHDEIAVWIRKNSRYLKSLSRQQFEGVLDNWLEKQLERKEVQRTRIHPVEKLFLNYLYAKKIDSFSSMEYFYEFDHIYPISLLKETAKRDNTSFAMSCVGNLVLVPSEVNNKKGDKWWDEFSESKEFEKFPGELKEMVKELLLEDPSSLHLKGFVKNDQLKISREDFAQIMQKRFNKLKVELYKTYSIY